MAPESGIGHGDAVAIRADVGDEIDVERLFAQTIEMFGPIDAVVHAVRGQVTATTAAGDCRTSPELRL